MYNLILTPEDCAELLRHLTGWVRPNAEMLARLEAHARLVPPPLNGDKVWSGRPLWRASVFADGSRHNQIETVVRAKTKAEAHRLLSAAGNAQTTTQFAGHWGQTGNREQLAVAVERGVWAKGTEGWVKLA